MELRRFSDKTSKIGLRLPVENMPLNYLANSVGSAKPNHLTEIAPAMGNLVYSQIGKTLELEQVREGSDLKITLQWFIENDWTGKKDRWFFSLLPILTCQFIGGDVEAAVHLAAAWNLFHLAANIFDDIEDEGFVIGPNGVMPLGEAVNTATTLLFLAQSALDPLSETDRSPFLLELRRELNQTGIHICVSQHQDLVEMTKPDVSLGTYWQITGAKSGRFFGWACRAGAVIGGGSPSQVVGCDSYGYNLGVLLQIFDDWVGLSPDEGVSDLALGKRTLPTIYALAVAPPGQRQGLMTLLDQACQSREAEIEAQAEIIRLGGLHYTLVEAEMRRKRAETALLAILGTHAYLLELLITAFPFSPE